MSRVAKKPIPLPSGVNVTVDNQLVTAKGPKGETSMNLHSDVDLVQEDGVLKISPNKPGSYAMAGTMRALLNNMVHGVSVGFEKKLELVGVGYRAQAKGNALSLTLGFSHPVEYPVPEGLQVETPSQTEIVIRGVDKQKLGQAAAEIRAYRPPEPYKGKGVRYSDEYVARKEAKKK